MPLLLHIPHIGCALSCAALILRQRLVVYQYCASLCCLRLAA